MQLQAVVAVDLQQALYQEPVARVERGRVVVAAEEADVVFAADDADEPAEVRRRIMRDRPNVRAFSAALCRVTVSEGGFLGFGGDVRTFYLGTESQYAPLGPSTCRRRSPSQTPPIRRPSGWKAPFRRP